MKLKEVTELKASNLDDVKNYTSGDLHISYLNLTSLEGCPEKIDGYFNCSNNQLSSFEHFPKFIGNRCFISINPFTSFKDIDKHIEYIGNNLYAYNTNITSGYSDLFGIDGLQGIEINDVKIQKIANTYLPTKDLIEFQDEMIKSGFESYL